MPVTPVDLAGGALRGEGGGAQFLLAAGFVYEVIAANCSSPQTTEINADTRARTLMKWVNLGIIQAAGFVVGACLIDPKHTREYLAGAALAGGVLYGSYIHAKAEGLASGEPGTES